MGEKVTTRAEAAKPEAVRRPITLAELLAEDDRPDAEIPVVDELAPLTAPAPIPRAPRALPVPDLSRSARVWQLIGEGNSGKTMLARWFADQLAQRDALVSTVLAALAPGNRSLTRFVETVMQPPSTDPKETAEWARKLLRGMARRRSSGVMDFGGGDASLGHLIRAVPDFVARMEEEGLALVAAYCLTPRVDDLAFLTTFERLGYRPRATALILNLGKAETPGAFEDVRRQPAYRAALERGAVELWMPAMPQSLALSIERKRLHFTQARDGRVPEGSAAVPIGGLERVMVREWLEAMEAEFAPVRTWLPWE